MSPVFEKYATFYDVYYRQKDYAAECAYVLELLKRHSSRPVKSLLDLGCGTGSHDVIWAQSGLKVTGIDLSEAMLEQARKKAADAGVSVQFAQGDLRSFQAGGPFDAATSMFAVLGYMTANEDLEAALLQVRRHLSPGGLFIFDAWHGPAVLSESPTAREKSFPGPSPGVTIQRLVRPEWDVYRHVVHTHITVRQVKDGKTVDEIQESHPVRYFFPQELAYFLKKTGFDVAGMTPFLSLDGTPGLKDWNFTVIARASESAT